MGTRSSANVYGDIAKVGSTLYHVEASNHRPMVGNSSITLDWENRGLEGVQKDSGNLNLVDYGCFGAKKWKVIFG